MRPYIVSSGLCNPLAIPKSARYLSTAPVTITIARGLAEVQPACAEVLLPLLSHADLEFCRARRGLEHVRRTRRVADVRGERLLTAAGCAPRVRDALLALGREVQVRDLRGIDGARYYIDRSDILAAEQAFFGLANAITGNVQGVLATSRPSACGALIGHVARLLRRARIFVACATREQTHLLAAALAEHVGGEVDRVHGGEWRSPCRVVVGTYTSLDTSDPADWDALVYGDADEAICRRTPEGRGRYGRHRVYALADARPPRSDKDRLLHELLAGPVIYSYPQCQAPPPIDVVLARYAAPSERWPDAPRQRKAQLWRHARRNAAVAAVARALAEGDRQTLWEHGLDPDGPGRPAPSAEQGIVVLVEAAAHAEELAPLLPGWPVLHARPGGAGAAGGRDYAWGLPTRSITTVVRAAGYGTLAAGIVVMAGGGTWPQIPVPFAGRGGPLLVVDFDDDLDAGLAEQTRRRLAAYAEAGWRVHRHRASPDRTPNTSRRPRWRQRR